MEDIIDLIVEDKDERMGKVTQRPHHELWEIHRKNGKVTWGDVYSHILSRRYIFYSQEELDPEIWGIFNMDPKTEMICIVEDDDEEYWIPKFDDGTKEADAKAEMLRKANDWKVTFSIIISMVVVICLIIWLSFKIIA